MFIFTSRPSWRYRNTDEDSYRNLHLYNIDKIHSLSCMTNIGVILKTGLSLYKPNITQYCLELRHFISRTENVRQYLEYFFSSFRKRHTFALIFPLLVKIVKRQFLKNILDFYKRWFVLLKRRFPNNLTTSHLLKLIFQCWYSR